jgi:selenocysteine lyase/cysteine desulfurase
VGGGIVEYVSLEDFGLKEQVTAREEAGTPNIPGSIAMGLIAEALMQVGMAEVAAAESALTAALLGRLRATPGVTVYGSADLAQVPRAGVVSFNVDGLPHGLVAAYLNDFHNIAVRNGCFCAQPYANCLLGVDDDSARRYRDEMIAGDRRAVPGMVRASLGVYSTAEDVAALGAALDELQARPEQVRALYRVDREGTWSLVDGTRLPRTFTVADAVARFYSR